MVMQEVTMYRVVCDREDCGVSACDGTDYYAWADRGQALDDAKNADWYVVKKDDGSFATYCFDHNPRCAYEDCGAPLLDDEFGAFCEDHAPEDPA